ncbi:MAG: T9SS type A sorting domain-containing protein [Ginsengibacter sp.]
MKNLITLVTLLLFVQFTAISSPFNSPDSNDLAQIRSNLYIVAPDGSSVLMDGTLTQYSSSYSNALDGMDARKLSNPGENWGMLRGNTVYVIERRHTIEGNDSIFFKMWNMRIITYRIEFLTTNLNTPGMQAILEDKYLKTSTPINLNGTTNVDFSVTSDPNSLASDRFRIIFSDNIPVAAPMPHFTAIGAFVVNNQVNINWTTENQNNLQGFDIEKSRNNVDFISQNNIEARNTSNSYHWVDANSEVGDNYYRIRNIGNDGTISYSNTMKVTIPSEKAGFNIYPNPATANNLNLQMINQQAGTYEIKIVNSFGQQVMTQIINYAGGNGIQKLQPQQNIPPGVYHIEITAPGNIRNVINVVF